MKQNILGEKFREVHVRRGTMQGRRIYFRLLLASYLPRLSVKTSLFGADGLIRRFLLLKCVSMFRAKSVIFLARAEQSYFSGFFRRQPSACASLRRSKGGFVQRRNAISIATN